MEKFTQQLKVVFRVTTEDERKPLQFSFEHTRHSYRRAQQRGFSKDKIAAALEYGVMVYKQGLIYYILGQKDIPDSLRRKKEQLQNTVVIVSGSSNQIITCYRSADPFKFIRSKSEKLFKNAGHAA